jgi:hypothetical protein
MGISYGLDLGGFSTGSSRVVRVEEDESGSLVRARLVSSRWSTAVDGRAIVSDHRDAIHNEMAGWDSAARIVVDVPIDLQELPYALGAFPGLHWQLTLRAIDYALSGLPPLADRIGAAVARWRALTPFGMDQLGVRVFETYPASSLVLSNHSSEGYKRSEARFQSGRWQARSPKHRLEAKRDWSPEHPLAKILDAVRATSPEEFCCNDDVVDALLCGLAGLPGPHLFELQALSDYATNEAKRQGRVLPTNWSPPRGYRLLDFRRATWQRLELQ